MKIDKLLELIEAMPAYGQLLDRLDTDNARTLVLDGAKPYLIACLYHNLKRPMLVVTAQPENSHRLAEQISTWLGTQPVNQMPEPDALPFTRVSPDSVTELEKLQVLSLLGNHESANEPPIVVASIPALVQKLPSAELFSQAWRQLKQGMDIEPYQLIRELQALGYRMESLVEVPGSISHRGGILDIYPPTSDMPLRLEFFSNSIDSLRLFEPVSQRSLKAVDTVKIGPVGELAPHFLGGKEAIGRVIQGLNLDSLNYEARREFEQELTLLLENQTISDTSFYAPLFKPDSLLDYLSPDCLIVVDEPDNIRQEAEFWHAEASQILEQKLALKELPANFPKPYFTWPELDTGLAGQKRLELADLSGAEDKEVTRLDFAPAQSYAGQLPAWIRKARQLAGQGKRIVAVSHQASRLAELLEQEGTPASAVSEIVETPAPGSLTLVQGLLAQGWVMRGNIHLFTDSEIFGFLKQQRLTKRRPVPRHKLFVDIKPGGYVVHVEHGIGKFASVVTMTTNGIAREYLLLLYAGGDRLYVPTDQIDRVGRYIGAGDRAPILSRLGSLEWVKSKERARKSAEDIAQELINLYAAREVVPGFAYPPDNAWQTEMEAAFPYVETPDQFTAIEQVKEDMSHPRPMDRLVCGDVGYGKTEVALRAAFKAVMGGKQAAILVPTTVLAQQHYSTFNERLSAFPLRVEMLSRFKSHREQKEIGESLANGTVDIVIGTHRLLQKDVSFKDLGLLVIDEEQRFGVAHKEYLKKMRREVDVLTLSATPIPRTLHMSLVGVRDMSVMETPPEERLPIKTYVAEYDEHLVREAILRELERNGQVFFVHNRVQSIAFLTQKLKTLVPEARMAIGHGQMPEDELETVMADFVKGKVDVLLCTTIIESGLDVPNANTLIINQADKLGLTQLYQLRGRVGRGTNLAYAYFLYDKGKRLTPDAGKRLRTIFEATELGAGFGIAMKDLEIRGAGNILGVKQSGHINAVGFSLYTQLLAEAVEDIKAQKAGQPVPKISRLPAPTIDLPQPAFIPEDYVADTDTRLSLYQCLAGAKNTEQVAVMTRDFKDRFGPLPAEVQNLLYAVKIKVLGGKAHLESVSTEHGHIVLRRPSGLQFDLRQPTPVLRNGVRVSLNQIRLDLKVLGKDWQEVLEDVVSGLG